MKKCDYWGCKKVGTLAVLNEAGEVADMKVCANHALALEAIDTEIGEFDRDEFDYKDLDYAVEEWVNWIATDSDGEIWGYEFEPDFNWCGWWETTGDAQLLGKRSGYNWSNSLRRVNKVVEVDEFDYSEFADLAPNNHEWIATDRDGSVYSYRTEPERAGRGRWVTNQSCTHLADIDLTGKDWRKSLRRISEIKGVK